LLLYKLNVSKCIIFLSATMNEYSNIICVLFFFVPNSLARRCKLLAHLLWFFSKSWLRCNAALLVFFSFATLVSLSLFFCSWFLLYARFIPHSPCSALCFSCRLLIVIYALVYVLFRWVFLLCASLFFFFYFSLSVFLLLYSVHALFSLYYSCFFVSYFYLVFCVVSCALRAMFLSKLFCNIVSYITVL